MKRKGKILGWLGAALCVLALAGHAEAARRLMVVGTAPAGSASFAYMVGVSAIINKAVPGLALSPQETGGSVANIRLLDEGKIQLSGFSGLVAADAVEGKGSFKKKRKIKVLFSMYQHRFLWYARKKSEITSWETVAGKKIIVGSPGGSTRVVGDLVANAKGMKGKATLVYLRWRAMIDALRDGTVHAGYGLATGASLAPATREVLSTIPVTVFGVDEGTISKLIKMKLGLARGEFPPNYLFDGSPGFATVSEYLIAGVPVQTDNQTAYQITQAVQDNLKLLPKYSPTARGVKPEDALKGIPSNVPFHPGAVRYYKEKGLMK